MEHCVHVKLSTKMKLNKIIGKKNTLLRYWYEKLNKRSDWYNKHSLNDGKNWHFFQNALLPHQKCENK